MDSRTPYFVSVASICIGILLLLIGFGFLAVRNGAIGTLFYAGLIIAAVGSCVAFLDQRNYFEKFETETCQTSDSIEEPDSAEEPFIQDTETECTDKARDSDGDDSD